MAKIITGPFNRVEGDLQLQLDIAKGQVTDAQVTSPMYRGFEQILLGKDPLDALVYTPRICGICSISQSIACAYALAGEQTVPANAQWVTNILLGTENVLDHLTHFYLFFMPDFAKSDYKERAWHPEVSHRFQAQTGEALQTFLPARADMLTLMGLLAGKWPHTLSIRPGGSSKSIDKQELMALHSIVNQFVAFLESTVLGTSLESFLAIDNYDSLEHFAAQNQGDLATFVRLAQFEKLQQLGKTTVPLMSYGNYRTPDGKHVFASGVYKDTLQPLDTNLIREYAHYSHLAENHTGGHPFENQTTLAQDEKQAAYSWCQAPRLDGQVVEVGALARQVVDGQPLITDCYQRSQANVANRVFARLVEAARIAALLRDWSSQLVIGEPFYHNLELPKQFQAQGLVEAARGSLGHWLVVDNGKIVNYQIIAPTTWNFSPMDNRQQKGALEQALIGVQAADSQSVMVDHVVRSFDPCMVCTAH